MREVGVHLDNQLGSRLEGALEPGEVRRAQPMLLGPVEDLDLGIVPGEPVGQLARSVRRRVVDDQDGVVGRELVELGPNGLDERHHVLALVIGRDDHPDRAGVGGHGPSI